jgi:hypothetical protein
LYRSLHVFNISSSIIPKLRASKPLIKAINSAKGFLKDTVLHRQHSRYIKGGTVLINTLTEVFCQILRYEINIMLPISSIEFLKI